MKALLVKEPMNLSFIEVEKPSIKNTKDVLIKLKAAGICGSDVHIYHGTNPLATYPRVMGHEMVGIIEEIGEDVKDFEIGDHVIINQVINCGDCFPCSQNRPNVCFDLKVRGVHIDGGYQEFIIVPDNDIYRIPKELPFHEAVMIEPTSIAYQGVSRADVKKGDIVFILGAGALGKSIIKVLSSLETTIIVADIIEERLEEAKELGAHHVLNSKRNDLIECVKELSGGHGPTVSIDAAGILGSLDLLTQLTCNAGRVITMGFSKEFSQVAQLNITSKELDIRGSRLQNNKFIEVIEDYQKERLNFKDLVSHIIPFKEAKTAFQMIDSNDTSIKKIVLSFE